jgi:3-hydroxyisobutyrate dehydrogenase
MAEAGISVGFIGLGMMGEPMSRRVAQGGFALTLFDVDETRRSALAKELGATAVASPAALAARTGMIVTMLPTSAVVAEVLQGPDGVLATLRPGSIVVEMSSGVPARTRELAALVAAAGSALIDAPVSGGVSRARIGDLAIMVGGDKAPVDAAAPLLKTMGSSILRTGTVGSGHAMKALNNLVNAGGFLIGIEALLIGRRFGLDPSVMVDVLNASSGMNNSTQKKFKQFVLSRRFDAGFSLDLMIKDLGIALGLAHDSNTAAPFSALCREMWGASRTVLGPGQDHTAFARFCESLAGTELD